VTVFGFDDVSGKRGHTTVPEVLGTVMCPQEYCYFSPKVRLTITNTSTKVNLHANIPKLINSKMLSVSSVRLFNPFLRSARYRNRPAGSLDSLNYAKLH